MANAGGRRGSGVARPAGGAVVLAAVALLAAHAALARGRRADAEYKTPETDAYKQADARTIAAQVAYRDALLPLLRNRDPYQRRLALERLQHTGVAMLSRDALVALVPILEETVLLPSETCVREPARCGEAAPVSNGMLAAQLRRGDLDIDFVVARVAARPEAADAIIAAGVNLLPIDLARALPSTKNPAAQAALLRLTLRTPCGYALGPAEVVALQDSQDATVRRLAALALLRYSGCGRRTDAAAAEARKRPLASVASRFDDATDADIIADCARIGGAADVFIPQLLTRLQRRPDNRQERLLILQTLGAMNELSQHKDIAIAQLYRMLLDRTQRSVHGAVLSALIAMWPHRAPEAKPALLALITAEPELFTKAIGLLHAWGARVTQAELARLDATYRRGCLSDDDGEICGAQSRVLGYLAADSKLEFHPLGRDGDRSE